MSHESDRPIVIAGGGPVGVIAALALARQGLPVQVFEADDHVNAAPRAATIHPATLEMLADLGLIDEVIRRGLVAPIFQFWDRASRELVAEFDHAVLKDDTPYPFIVQCEQHKLANLALERLAAFPGAHVQFSARVTSATPLDDHVEITVRTAAGTRTIAGSYLIGADGGRSTVRKALGIAFEGYTFPERFLVLTTPFDFGAVGPWCSRNYFSDPDEWAALFKVAGDGAPGLWRVVFPTHPHETDEQVFDEHAVQERLQKFFPKKHPYPVIHRNLYKVHQRVAATFRKGRAFLAGDAAHINNPLGGLGLNFGIHDAIELTNLLGSVIRREAPAKVLDQYDERRRPLNIEYVQRETVANKRRMEEKDPAVRAANFQALRNTAANPTRHRLYLLRTSLLESVRKPAASPLDEGDANWVDALRAG
jgi:3-(3-hydroxy-phenyl)propionate hydroxylase